MDKIHIRIPPELKAKAAKEAARLGLSLSEYLRKAIIEKMKR